MGCILYELVACRKAFSSDVAAFAHSSSKSNIQIPFDCRYRFGEYIERIIAADVDTMLHPNYSSRPSARLLVERFTHHKTMQVDGETALRSLHWAATNGDVEVVQAALDANVYATATYENTTALIRAALAGHTKVVKVLLDAKADVGAHYRYALMCAASNGHTEVVQTLLDARANVILQNTRIALPWAAFKGKVETVKMLLDAEVDMSPVQEEHYNTALILSVFAGQTKVVELLMNTNANFSTPPLLWAARRGRLKVVKLLLDARVDADLQDKDGNTALLWAASEGHKDVIQLLLDAAANVDIQNKYGDTGLLRAALNGHVDAVKVLLEAKAVDVKNKLGKTALSWAMTKGDRTIVKLFKDAKVKKATQNGQGKTAGGSYRTS